MHNVPTQRDIIQKVSLFVRTRLDDGRPKRNLVALLKHRPALPRWRCGMTSHRNCYGRHGRRMWVRTRWRTLWREARHEMPTSTRVPTHCYGTEPSRDYIPLTLIVVPFIKLPREPPKEGPPREIPKKNSI